jgi:ADP-ribose pyrophosphatase YjhB (NUDIX family)
MTELLKFNAKICLTSAAFLVRRQQVLLVKHKKLGIWLAPGGHIEPNELPHVAAERECFEESGVRVKALSAYPTRQGTDSQYVPLPFAINLHWISRSNFTARLKSPHPAKRTHSAQWPKGCEQHLVFCYLVQPMGSIETKQNLAETEGVKWFSMPVVSHLRTTADIQAEIRLALKLSRQYL